MSYADIVSTVALILATIDLIFHFLHSRKTTAPAIIHDVDPLPPYMTRDEITTVIVANQGNAKARIDQIAIDFSWNKGLQIILYDRKSKDKSKGRPSPYLNPNDEWTFERRFPEPPKGETGTIAIKTTFDRRSIKEDKFTVEGRKDIAFLMR